MNHNKFSFFKMKWPTRTVCPFFISLSNILMNKYMNTFHLFLQFPHLGNRICSRVKIHGFFGTFCHKLWQKEVSYWRCLLWSRKTILFEPDTYPTILGESLLIVSTNYSEIYWLPLSIHLFVNDKKSWTLVRCLNVSKVLSSERETIVSI